MDNATQHKQAVTGPHVRLVAGIGIIVVVTALFLYIYAKRKQNAAGSDTSAGSLGSGQSGSAWDSLTYNVNYTPASAGTATNNPGAPTTPGSGAPSVPTQSGTPKPPTHSGGTPVVKKPPKTGPHPTPPAHSGPTHPARTGHHPAPVHHTTTAAHTPLRRGGHNTLR